MNLSIAFTKDKHLMPATQKNETIDSKTYPCKDFTDVFSDVDGKKLRDIMDKNEIKAGKLVLYYHTYGTCSTPYMCVIC